MEAKCPCLAISIIKPRYREVYRDLSGPFEIIFFLINICAYTVFGPIFPCAMVVWEVGFVERHSCNYM